MNISPLNVIAWLHHSIKNVKLPYPVPALNLVDDNSKSNINNTDNKNGNRNNNLNHYMTVNDKGVATNVAGVKPGEKFTYSKCLSARKHGISACSTEIYQIVQLVLNGFNAALVMFSVGDAESFKLRKDITYQVINKLDVELTKLNIKRKKEGQAEIQVDYTYIGIVDTFCYDLRRGQRIENADLLRKGLEPLMKRVPHAAKVWDNVSTGSNVPFIVQLRLTDEVKFLGNLVIADLLQPEFQKPAVVKPACGIYYSFTQLRRVVVRAVTTHDFSKPFSVDLNSCVLTKFLAEYLVGLGRTVVIMHLNESLYHNIEETLYALRFAQFLQTIQCCIVPNKSDIRVEYYRRCLFDIIQQYEVEKVQHHQCKENLKLQEEELARVTELLNLQKQRIEKLVIECSNLQQQISVRQNNNDIDSGNRSSIKKCNKQEEERGKEGTYNADAGYALKSDRPHVEQTNNLHIVSNISDDTATPDHEKPENLTKEEQPNISLKEAWCKVQSIDAEFDGLEQEERLRMLEIELITLRNRSNTLSSILLNNSHDMGRQEGQTESMISHSDSGDLIIIESLDKKEEQAQKPKNAPSISRQADNEEEGYNNDGVIDKEQGRSNSTDEDDEEYYGMIRQLRSGNGLDVHEYQQICDEMNRAFTENIQKYERREQLSKRDNHRLQMELDKVSGEAKQYKEWFLEKQEMREKLQQYEENACKVNDEVDLLKSQLSICNREILKYKEQATKAEARWKEERESNRKTSEAMEAKYCQLHNHVEKLHHNNQSDNNEAVDKQGQSDSKSLMLRTSDIIASTIKNQPQQEQNKEEKEQRIFALKNDDQGLLMYDTDDGEDTIMQSATTSLLVDNSDSLSPKNHHRSPPMSTSPPKMVKRTKLLVHHGDDITMDESSSGGSIVKKGQSSTQNLPITSNTKNSRRRSSTSDNNNDSNSRPEEQSSNNGLGHYQQNNIEKENPNMRTPLQSINENVQVAQKKRRVSNKK